MGWIGRRLAIVAALALFFSSTSGLAGQIAVGRTHPNDLTPLVKIQSFATVRGAERTLSQGEFRASSQQGLIAFGDELLPTPDSIGVFTTPVVASPIPFSHLGLRWHGQLSDLLSVRVGLRASRDGSAWTPWTETEVDDDVGSGIDGQSLSRLVGLDVRDGGYDYAQARLTLHANRGSARPSVSSLSFIFIDPFDVPGAVETTEVGGASQTGIYTPDASKPSVISRTSWGSPDGQNSPNWPPEYRTVTNIVIHHTATTNNSTTNWAAQVRAIWYYHAYYAPPAPWGDIGYNYLIDPNGFIYEGRAGGDDVVGGHALQYNYGSMGVAFLGTYSYSSPSPAAQISLTNLLAWKANQRGIDPMVLSRYFVDKNVPTIVGHRDVLSTDCPGSAAYSLMNTFRGAVRDRLVSASPPSSSVAPLPRFQNQQPFQVRWSGTDSAVNYYVQYRDGPDGAWVDWPGQSPTTGTSAQFSGGNGHTYYYRSLAVDTMGNREAKSADRYDAYTTVDTTPPSFNVTVPSSTTRNWFVVTWTGSDSISGLASSYDVDVMSDEVNWQPWLRGATGAGSFLFFGGTPGRPYYFKMTGWDLAGNSAASAIGGPIVAGSDAGGLSRIYIVSSYKGGTEN